jgi:hypothetical protein
MKKLLACLVALVMFGICSSSFGDYFIIYNVSSTVKEVNEGGIKGAIPLKSYLVVRLNDADEYVDANLVMYGKGQNKQKVYVQLDDQGGNNYIDVEIIQRSDRTMETR